MSHAPAAHRPARARERVAAHRAARLLVLALACLGSALLGGGVPATGGAAPGGVPAGPRCPKADVPATPPARNVAPQPGADASPGGKPRYGDRVKFRSCPPPPLRGDAAVPEPRSRPSSPPDDTARRPSPREQGDRPAAGPAGRGERVVTRTRPSPAVAGSPSVRPGPAGAAAGRTAPRAAEQRGHVRYRQSLVYSGVLGLLLASIGVTMIGRRRRHW